jgi:hypothetical protein
LSNKINEKDERINGQVRKRQQEIKRQVEQQRESYRLK